MGANTNYKYIKAMKTVYCLCYLNEANVLHKGKGWAINTIFENFPKREELINEGTCLEDTPVDNAIADKLIKNNGMAVRLVYSNDEQEWLSKFFEVAIIEVELGKPLRLWDMFITGYVTDKEDIIINNDGIPTFPIEVC